MNANAYRCQRCGKVEDIRSVEFSFAGGWLRVEPLGSLHRLCDVSSRLGVPFVVCSPECCVAYFEALAPSGVAV